MKAEEIALKSFLRYFLPLNQQNNLIKSRLCSSMISWKSQFLVLQLFNRLILPFWCLMNEQRKKKPCIWKTINCLAFFSLEIKMSLNVINFNGIWLIFMNRNESNSYDKDRRTCLLQVWVHICYLNQISCTYLHLKLIWPREHQYTWIPCKSTNVPVVQQKRVVETSVESYFFFPP